MLGAVPCNCPFYFPIKPSLKHETLMMLWGLDLTRGSRQVGFHPHSHPSVYSHLSCQSSVIINHIRSCYPPLPAPPVVSHIIQSKCQSSFPTRSSPTRLLLTCSHIPPASPAVAILAFCYSLILHSQPQGLCTRYSLDL